MVGSAVGQLESLQRFRLKTPVKSTTYDNPTKCRVLSFGACLSLQTTV
jgi:hypothetical protein